MNKQLPTIDEHQEIWKTCRQCPLGSVTGFRIFYRGTLPCDVLFVGEAPGDVEVGAGMPFIGPAGQELDRWISEVKAKSKAFSQLEIAFTNAVLCLPRDNPSGKNRAPKGSEVSACTDRLEEFVGIAKPKMIIACGKIAFAAVTKLNRQISVPVPNQEIMHPSNVIRQGERGRVDRSKAIRGISDAFTATMRLL